MQIVVTYYPDGTITGVVVCSPDGPPMTPDTEAGEYVTALDVPEGMLNLRNPAGERGGTRIIERLKAFRVESNTRLVRRSDSESSS
jgi:hypothetical protein